MKDYAAYLERGTAPHLYDSVAYEQQEQDSTKGAAFFAMLARMRRRQEAEDATLRTWLGRGPVSVDYDQPMAESTDAEIAEQARAIVDRCEAEVRAMCASKKGQKKLQRMKAAATTWQAIFDGKPSHLVWEWMIAERKRIDPTFDAQVQARIAELDGNGVKSAVKFIDGRMVILGGLPTPETPIARKTRIATKIRQEQAPKVVFKNGRMVFS